MEPGHERRAAPRVPYRGDAVVFVGNDRYDARIIDLSKVGALIAPPVELKPGAYLRLNIVLPQLDEVIDVDAVVARETKYEGTYACGVAFMNVSERASILLDAFIKRALQWQAESAEMEAVDPESEMEAEEVKPASGTERRESRGEGRKPAIARLLLRKQTVKMPKQEPTQKKRIAGRDPLDRFIKEVNLKQIYQDALRGVHGGKKKDEV